ncbi:hypothetical protein ACL9RL_04130 [Plantibacter sp. Mn2098]|uniref:hypothetical protein n=1 Tax=Plantibacter sp. Mn2098 TaxID=3395266 RepID=UPI003BEB776D
MTDASPVTPAEPGEPEETVATQQVGIRRSPRYWRLMVLGAAAGVLAALILTVSFPKNPDFSQLQVFGFLLLVCGIVGVAIACLIGLLMERIVGRKIIVVTADRVDVRPAPAAPTGAAAASESPAAAVPTGHDAESESPSPTAER